MSLERAAVLDIREHDESGWAGASMLIASLAAHGRKLVVVTSPTRDRSRRDAAAAIRLSPSADPHARAMLLTSGAVEASASLARSLTAEGVRVSRIDPRKIAPLTRGHSLDAEPRSASAARFDRALRSADVVVVPAGLGVDEHDRPTYMGEAGGRIGALFLASVFELPLLEERSPARQTSGRGGESDAIARRKADLRASRRLVRTEAIEDVLPAAISA